MSYNQSLAEVFCTKKSYFKIEEFQDKNGTHWNLRYLKLVNWSLIEDQSGFIALGLPRLTEEDMA